MPDDSPEKAALLKLAECQSQDPVEGNPFRPNSSLHEIWENATRIAEQKVHLFNATYIGAVRELPQPQNLQEALAQLLGQHTYLIKGKFDIWAERGISVVWGDNAARAFDHWLTDYANAWLKSARTLYPPDIDVSWQMQKLRVRLTEYVEFWKSEGRRYVIEQKKAALAAQEKSASFPGDNGGFQVNDEQDENRNAVSNQEQRAPVIAKVESPSKYTFLTTPEAALYFGVKPRTIYRWRDGGKLREGARRGTITIASVKKLQKSRSKARVRPKDL